MDFSFDDFRKKQFEDRTGTVKLPNFGDSTETVVWNIRGLNSEDLATIDEAAEKNKALQSLIDAAVKATATGKVKDQVDGIKKMLGINGKVPDQLIRQYCVFELGSIEPSKPENRQDTVKFARVYPGEFKTICNRIYELSGLGALEKKKQKSSLQTEKSEKT